MLKISLCHEKTGASNNTFSGTGGFSQSKNKMQIIIVSLTQKYREALHYLVHSLTLVNTYHLSPMSITALVTAGNNLLHLLSDTIWH